MSLFTQNKLLNIKFISKTTARLKSASTSEYCLESVKKYDYENFVCNLLLRNTTRTSAFAIRSFNIETGRVREQASQGNIALMRLKFWEDAIDRCYLKDPSKVPQHPVAIEIFKAISRTPLTKRYFKNLITARADYLNKNTFENLEEVERYTEKVFSNVYYLILESCGVKDIHADHAASHLGKAQGITQQLRTIPIAAKVKFFGIPQDILVKHKISQEDILRAKNTEKVIESSFEIASLAYQHLQKARSMMDKVPKEARGVLLPAVAVDNYLTRLQNVEYNIFHPSLQHRTWVWLPKLWYRNYQNKY